VSPLAWVGFVIAAMVGAPLRYLVDGAIAERAEGVFPWGTFVINASGSLLLGVLTGLGLYHAFPKVPKVILGTGFCGSYTTFSTFTYETVELLEEGAVNEAARNAIGTLLVGAGAAALGLVLAAL
jgi:fluoride exporter